MCFFFQNVDWSHQITLYALVSLVLERTISVLYLMGRWCYFSCITLCLLQVSHPVFWISCCILQADHHPCSSVHRLSSSSVVHMSGLSGCCCLDFKVYLCLPPTTRTPCRVFSVCQLGSSSYGCLVRLHIWLFWCIRSSLGCG